MSIPPMLFSWDGEAMVPFRPPLADQHFVAGEYYTLAEHRGRSDASHNHYFAAVKEGWRNLPEHEADRFPTDEHLRKYALIKCGYCDVRDHPAGSAAEAQRLRAFMEPMDEYALVIVVDSVVRVHTARTQKKRAMGAEDFQASKQAVLDYVAGLIGVTTDELAANAKQAA